MTWLPVLVREADRGGRPVLRLGNRQLHRYLEFVSARARPNTVLATGYDLKVFFSLVPKDPVEVKGGSGVGQSAPLGSRGREVWRSRSGTVAVRVGRGALGGWTRQDTSTCGVIGQYVG